MTDIQYLSPRTLDEAISAFAAAGSAARIMAGGTDLSGADALRRGAAGA